MMDWNAITGIATIVGLLVGSVSAYIAIRGQQRNHEWNRKKTSEETLSRLVEGGFTDLLDEIENKFSWHIIGDDVVFKEITENMEEARRKELEQYLRRILRILETISINMNHGIIEEKICYEYLASIGPEIYKKCEAFIEDERILRNEPRVFYLYTETMKRWIEKNRQIEHLSNSLK